MCDSRRARDGSDHTVTDLDERHLPKAAEVQARWEHLGTGFSNIHMWGAVAPLRELPSRFFSGYNLESRSGEPVPLAYDELFRSKKNRGFQAATLRRLLRRDVFEDLSTRSSRNAGRCTRPGPRSQRDRLGRFFIAHDWRAHAGGIPWKLSFGSWPVLPMLDRGLLETIFTLPASSLVDRRAQDELLRRRFPDLARLPLDRNSEDPFPLLPSFTERVHHAVLRAAAPVRRRVPRRLERRYYHRIYDINGPGWRAVRRLADPHRERLAPLFNMDVLAELLPPANAHIHVRSTTTTASGRSC